MQNESAIFIVSLKHEWKEIQKKQIQALPEYEVCENIGRRADRESPDIRDRLPQSSLQFESS